MNLFLIGLLVVVQWDAVDRLRDIGLVKDPELRVRAVLVMLQSSCSYYDVLSYSGIEIADLDEESDACIRAIVAKENVRKDEEEKRNLPDPEKILCLSSLQRQMAARILRGELTPEIDPGERMIIEAVIFRRAILPTNPHFPHSLPPDRVQKIGKLGIIATSVYRDIWLVMRMDRGRKEAAGSHQGINTWQGNPVAQLKSDLCRREKMGIDDAITKRLRSLLPQMETIEEKEGWKGEKWG